MIKNDCVWHEQQENILKEWSEISSSYRYMHDRAHGKFHTQNLWTAIPVIVLSTVTGTANFAHEAFPESWKNFVPLGIGFLNLAAGLITTIAQFLRISEKMEGHRAASISYSKLARNIQVELSLPVSERTVDGSSFIMECRGQLDRLLEQSPDLDDKVINYFEKKFHAHDFHKPAIIDLRSVAVYKDNEDAVKKKQKILEDELQHRKKILEEERKIREDILKEEQKIQQKTIKEKLKNKAKKKQEKMENMTAGDIGNRMTKLLGHIENQKSTLELTFSTSDDDSPDSMASDKSDGELQDLEPGTAVTIEIADLSNNNVDE